MFELPTSIMLGEKQFNIRKNGDFRMILDCFSALQDVDLSQEERVLTSLIIFYDGINDLEDVENLPDLEMAIKEMFKFFNCGQEESTVGVKANYKLIDWQQDEQLIASAVNNVAGQEVRLVPYLHWWTFLGYYNAVGECPLSHIIGIRNKIAKGEKLEKHEQKFKMENPNYFNWDRRTLQEREADEWLTKVWNK